MASQANMCMPLLKNMISKSRKSKEWKPGSFLYKLHLSGQTLGSRTGNNPCKGSIYPVEVNS